LSARELRAQDPTTRHVVFGGRQSQRRGQVRAAALVQRREVRYVSATSGFGDMVCEVILRSRDDLYPFLTTVVGTLPGVREVDVALELVTLKRAYLVLDQWPLPTHGRHYTRMSDDTTAFGT